MTAPEQSAALLASQRVPTSASVAPIRVGSLCSGYGGLDMGVQLVYPQAQVVWHVEYDPQPSKILAHHWPDVPNHGDVKHTDWTGVEPIEVLTAGYPCQPFSHAGLRKGADDPRHLWPGVARAISVLRPRLAVLENVRGHVSLGLDAVLGDLAELGYDARWGVVRASDAGAPHGRARIFIIATDARGERHGRGEDAGSLGRVDGAHALVSRERERPRPEPVDRGSAAASDARGGQLSRPSADRHGLLVAAERGDRAAADPDDTDGRRSDQERGPLGRDAAAGRRESRVSGLAAAASDADSDGRAWLTGLPAERGAVHGDSRGDADGRGSVVEWGAYAPAVARWEAITGRAAPRPTEPARTGERLSPRFVEWMMGLPAGHVTGVPGLPRNAQLKALGNGVVQQQAALATRLLLPQAVAA